jgi:hypothetical protein
MHITASDIAGKSFAVAKAAVAGGSLSKHINHNSPRFLIFHHPTKLRSHANSFQTKANFVIVARNRKVKL